MGKAPRNRKKLHSTPVKASTAKETGSKVETGESGVSKEKVKHFPWGSNEVKEGSRGQRKRRKGRERAVLKLDLVKRVQKHTEVHKHGAALGDVESLTKVLDDVEAEQSKKESNETTQRKLKPGKRMRNKRRAVVQKEEVSLFRQVLSHPEFKVNAVRAINTHLQNTVVAEANT